MSIEMTEVNLDASLLDADQQNSTGSDNAGANTEPSTTADASNSSSDNAPLELSSEDITYTASSFTAVMWPVAATMLVASFIAVALKPSVAVTSSAYTFYAESAGDTGGQKLGKAVVNALVIIGIVGGITFFLVALFYFKCYKVVYGWLGFSFLALLGYTGAYCAQVALAAYSVAWDKISLYFFFFNFAAVGVYAIFVGDGMPRGTAQGYLVAVSVLEAWLIGRLLPEWTSWAVLVAIALYDLCAVLAPCGPLRWLLKVAARDGDELTDGPMRAMLYDASLGDDGDDDDDGGDGGGDDGGGDDGDGDGGDGNDGGADIENPSSLPAPRQPPPPPPGQVHGGGTKRRGLPRLPSASASDDSYARMDSDEDDDAAAANAGGGGAEGEPGPAGDDAAAAAPAAAAGESSSSGGDGRIVDRMLPGDAADVAGLAAATERYTALLTGFYARHNPGRADSVEGLVRYYVVARGQAGVDLLRARVAEAYGADAARELGTDGDEPPAVGEWLARRAILY